MKFAKMWVSIIVFTMIVGGLGLTSVGILNENTSVVPTSELPTLVVSASVPQPPQTMGAYKVPRCVLAEDYTNWGCGPCAVFAPYFEEAAMNYTGEYLENVAPVCPHFRGPSSVDPLNNYPPNKYAMDARADFYYFTGVPAVYYDGLDGPRPNNVIQIQNAWDALRAEGANMIIESMGYIDEVASTGWIKVHVECTFPTTTTDQRLMAYLWENNISRPLEYAGGLWDTPPYPNGEMHMVYASWMMFPDSNGTKVSLKNPGDYFDWQYNFTIDTDKEWVIPELGVSIFIQDYGGTKLVEQAKVELFKKPVVEIMNPNPTALHQIFTDQIPINWEAMDTQDGSAVTIDLSYSTNNGETWTDIATGLANTPPYLWDTATLDSSTVKLRVSATDSLGMKANATSFQFFSVDTTPDDMWFLQTQATILGGKKDLDMKPMERETTNFWDDEQYAGLDTTPVSATGDIVLESYVSDYTAWTTTELAGFWSFSVNGKVNVSSTLPQGNLLALGYAYTGSTPRLVFTTDLDDELVGSFTSLHPFDWTYDVPPGTTISIGERIGVDIVFRATAASPTALYDWNMRKEVKMNGTVTSDFTKLAASDNQYETLKEVNMNLNPPLVFENFTSSTPFPPIGWGRGDSPANCTVQNWNWLGGSQAEGETWPQGEARWVTDFDYPWPSQWRFWCGPIDTTGMTSLDLGWSNYIFFNFPPGPGMNYSIQTATSSDGPWTDTPWKFSSSDGYRFPDPEFVTFTENVGSSSLYFAFALDGVISTSRLLYWYVDEVLLQETMITSTLEQRYTVSVPPGESPYTFSVEGYRSASADNDNFEFDYSTDGSVWNNMVTISSTSETTQTYTLPAVLPATFYIRVRDTVRTDGAVTLSSVYLDRMYVMSTAPTKVTIGMDGYNTMSFVVPKIDPQVMSMDISLSSGWNLVSLPFEQQDTSINEVLQSIGSDWNSIQFYDAVDADHWKTYTTYKPPGMNDLSDLNHSMGFWIHTINPCILNVTGSLQTSTSIPLYAGWNLVGYPTTDTTTDVNTAFLGTGADRVEVFDPVEPYGLKVAEPTYLMQPGEGYWVRVPVDTTWTVDW